MARLIDSLMAKAGVTEEDKESCKKCSRQEILEKMTPDEVQMLAALPPKLQETIWTSLGIAE